jgi:hypothetical protein
MTAKKKRTPLELAEQRYERAKAIALLINKEDIDTRGKLFMEIASELEGCTQFYTAKLFREIAMIYGGVK